MKKYNILRKNQDFGEIINSKEKKNYKNKYFLIYMRNNQFNTYRIGISVPTKIGKAVIRNKIKRQIKDIIDDNKQYILNSIDYVIIVRKEILDLSYKEIWINLVSILKNICKG